MRTIFGKYTVFLYKKSPQARAFLFNFNNRTYPNFFPFRRGGTVRCVAGKHFNIVP